MAGIAALCALAAACGPKPKSAAERENDTTAAEVLRLVPADVDLLAAVRSIAMTRDLGETMWKALLDAPPLRTMMASEMEKDVRRSFPELKDFAPADFTAAGFRLAGGAAAFERGNYSTGKVDGFLVAVSDQEKFLAFVQARLEAGVKRASASYGPMPAPPYPDDPPPPDYEDMDMMFAPPGAPLLSPPAGTLFDMEIMPEPPPPPPGPTPKVERVAHPAGRGIVSFRGYDWSDFRWDIAFRDGYALLVESHGTWDGARTVPPEPSAVPVAWLDMKPEASIWKARFDVEFRDAHRAHDALLFVSFTGVHGKDLEAEAARGDAPALVKDLVGTRGILLTGQVGDHAFTVHGSAPTPMVGKLVKYFRASPGGGDPMRVVSKESHDVYRTAFNLDEMYAMVAKADHYMIESAESGARASLGVEVKGDVIGNFTGAFAATVGPRWDQLTIAAGVRDDGRAAKVAEALARVSMLMSMSAEEIGAKLELKTEKRGATKVNDLTLTPKAPGTGAALAPLHVYLAAGKGLFVMTTDSAAVDRALGDGGGTLPAAMPGDAGPLFGVDWFGSAYCRLTDPAKAVRALAGRIGLPSIPGIGDLATFPAGLDSSTRPVADATRYVMDRIYDFWGGYGLRGDGFVFDFTMRTL